MRLSLGNTIDCFFNFKNVDKPLIWFKIKYTCLYILGKVKVNYNFFLMLKLL